MPDFQKIYQMFFISFLSVSVIAGASRTSVKNGNQAYSQGKWDEALKAFENASVDAPESPVIDYNKGTVYFKKGEFQKAFEYFQKAALSTKDLKLEARCKFNSGNCAFMESERQSDSDLEKSLNECKNAIQHYQDALRIDPEFQDARENIEVVRLVMKSILDEQKKQQEEQKKQKEAQKQLMEKLKKMINNQKQVLKETSEVSNNSQQQKTDESSQVMKDLTTKQNQLSKETKDFSSQMSQALKQSQNQMQQPKQQSPMEKMIDHVDKAGSEQDIASDKLEQSLPQPATLNQEKAVEELENTLKILTEGKKKQGQKQGQKKQGQKQESEPQKGQKSAKPEQKQDKKNNAGQKKQNEEEKDKQQMAQLPNDADKILKEEKENNERRRPYRQNGYREVDKDW